MKKVPLLSSFINDILKRKKVQKTRDFNSGLQNDKFDVFWSPLRG